MTEFLLLLCSLFGGDPNDRLIVKDSSSYVEINHVYREDSDGKITKRMTQIIWWEWRNQLLLPEKDKTGKNTGNWLRGSGFVVKDYRVTVSFSSMPNVVREITPRRSGDKWVCLFYDKDSQCIRSVVSKWMRTTHTLYDREVEDRDIFNMDFRTKLTKPK
jgi:hypothetical protein|tara:strand:+ start:375 stop:854 length:480 start_codon:yes stop_codon:yes gene_type:complete